MSEMVERVARGLAAVLIEKGADDRAFESWPAEYQDNMRTLARAAIEAMRKPTEEMDLAGVEAESYRSLGLLKVHHIWRSMIDAALSPDFPPHRFQAIVPLSTERG